MMITLIFFYQDSRIGNVVKIFRSSHSARIVTLKIEWLNLTLLHVLTKLVEIKITPSPEWRSKPTTTARALRWSLNIWNNMEFIDKTNLICMNLLYN